MHRLARLASICLCQSQTAIRRVRRDCTTPSQHWIQRRPIGDATLRMRTLLRNLKTTQTFWHSHQHFYYHRGGVRTRFMQSTVKKYISGCHVLLSMGERGMPHAPNFTRRNDRVGNLHNRVKLGKGILVTKCWGVRQGEGQRIGRMKYLFTSKRPESETLYPSRSSLTRDTARVGSSAHGWV